jgi:hypothetical protein
VPELALDDDQRHALASHLDGVGVATLAAHNASIVAGYRAPRWNARRQNAMR